MNLLTKLRNFLSGKDKFKLDANDGDGDGRVQDGTIFERPVELTKEGAKVKAKKVAADAAKVVAELATDVAEELEKPAPKKAAPKKKK